MMRGYVKSSPYFFRRIMIAAALMIALLLMLAAFVPAPLQEEANLARVPNPVKSAWFLLWIQELVSYSKYLIYAVLAAAAGFLALPWLPSPPPASHASWWGRDRWPVNLLALSAVLFVVVLTVVALCFRGKNWQLTVPF